MLFKDIVRIYGACLNGTPDPVRDPVASLLPAEEWWDFRRQMLEDISGATVYVLNADAARYADSFRDSVQDHTFSPAAALQVGRFISEVALPADLVWVEHDHGALTAERAKKFQVEDPRGAAPAELGERGFLIDNRSRDHLKVTLFRARRDEKSVVDPLTHLTCVKSGVKADMNAFTVHSHPHMLRYCEVQNIDQERLNKLEEQEIHAACYDIALPYMVFALIASRRDDIILSRGETLSRSEQKTATKFGKAWVTKAPPTHITIRIGDTARHHLMEQADRKQFESDMASGRRPPTEHWVSQHERRYQSGKVVLVRTHLRGQAPDPSVPRFVVGPTK